RAKVQNVGRKDWNESVIGSTEHRHNIRNGNNMKDAPAAANVGESFSDICANALLSSSFLPGRQLHQVKIIDEGQKTQRVHQETIGNADETDDDSAGGRPENL